jgi:hypothetical protein
MEDDRRAGRRLPAFVGDPSQQASFHASAPRWMPLIAPMTLFSAKVQESCWKALIRLAMFWKAPSHAAWPKTKSILNSWSLIL